MQTGINLRPATAAADADAVRALWRSARGTPFCVWNEAYPGEAELVADLATDGLFVLCDGEAIVGAVSIVPERELDDLPGWTETPRPCEIARVTVAPACRGRGLAATMIAALLPILRARGYTAVRLSVEIGHIPAKRTYARCGFSPVGEAELWGHRYVLMERELSDDGAGKGRCVRTNKKNSTRSVNDIIPLS